MKVGILIHIKCRRGKKKRNHVWPPGVYLEELVKCTEEPFTEMGSPERFGGKSEGFKY